MKILCKKALRKRKLSAGEILYKWKIIMREEILSKNIYSLGEEYRQGRKYSELEYDLRKKHVARRNSEREILQRRSVHRGEGGEGNEKINTL